MGGERRDPACRAETDGARRRHGLDARSSRTETASDVGRIGRGEVTQAQKAGLRPCKKASVGVMTRSASALPEDINTLKAMLDREGRIATTPERNRGTQGLDRPDGDTQRACPEIQTGLGAIEFELEATRLTGEPRRAARPRKAFPAHLERVDIVIQPEPWRKKRSRSQSSSPSNAVGRTGLRNGTVPPSLRYRGTVLRAHPNFLARRFIPQPSSCSRSIAATSSG